MDNIQKRVKDVSLSYKTLDSISYDALNNDGLCNVKPHSYQVYGIEWMSNSWLQRPSSGLILGDEMGLGKTLQSVSFLLHLKRYHKLEDPFLILSPLSVVDGWKQEFKRSAPSLNVLTFIGNKDSREEFRQKISSKYMSADWKTEKSPFDVILTSYEICLKDTSFLQKFRWKVLVVDEAHRLKNSSSLLYQELQLFDIGFKVLLTGTPVQNNLKELYSLLSFVSPDIFKSKYEEEFVEYFSKISQDPSSSTTRTELHALLKPFLLRRTKSEVILDLPKKTELVMRCGMSEEQKKLYKSILLKDLDAYNQDSKQKTRLLNILMQLRKCCNHPYIFPGVEPEPFQLGEHLVHTSGKLKILDKILKMLKKSGHKVLVFSQMTTMLDIVQDYLGYRDYTYERLDGSVRGEERFLAVNKFNATDDTFIFLLSTRAGGQGLNLATADTVIFLDNDFNPQNDLQAAARAHRIGQTRPVKIIRLVCQSTVEEIILRRAENKLKLTNAVIEGGQFSNVKLTDNPSELNDILKFGLNDLFNEEMKDIDDEELERLIGKTENGAWVVEKPTGENQTSSTTSDVQGNEDEKENMYVFEGFDYSKTKTSDQDKSKFETFVQAVSDALQTERNLRKDKGTIPVYLPDVLSTRKRKLLTDDEKAELKKKREENRAKRLKLMEEKKAEKMKKLRESLNYISCRIDIPDDSDSESVSSTESDESAEMNTDGCGLEYVVGDLTQPVKIGNKDRVIAHCVDDSGRWGSGGLFSAIDRHSKEPKKQYELASKAKDLELGDVHLVKFTEATKTSSAVYVALIVAHTRDRNNVLSSLLMNHLSDALEKLYHVAKETGASMHFPRIGYNAPNFNWYGTEKLIKKSLAQRKVRTLIYYYKRRQNINATSVNLPSSSSVIRNNLPSSSSSSTSSKTVNNEETEESTENLSEELSNIFTNCSVYFHEISDLSEVKKLARYIIAYDGDVEKQVTSQTTHIITSPTSSSLADIGVNHSVKVVNLNWVYECVKASKIISEELYTISPDS